MTQEEKDKIIRQKLENFAPPKLPRSTWEPAQTWDKLASQIAQEPKRRFIKPYLYVAGVAATVLLLLGVWLSRDTALKHDTKLVYQDTSNQNADYQNITQEETKENINKTQRENIDTKKKEVLPILTDKKQLAQTKVKSAQQQGIKKTQKSITNLKKLNRQKPELDEIKENFEIIEELQAPIIAQQKPITKEEEKEVSPQKVTLVVNQNTERKKMRLFVGKRDKSQAAEGFTRNKRNRKNIRFNPDDIPSLQAENTNAEVALLKVKLK